MDQKTATALDPKLKEVYDRVMGTSNQPSAPITPAPHPSTPQPGPAAQPPLTPPSPAIGLTPPITPNTSPATPQSPSMPGLSPMKDTLPPLPEKPLSPTSTPLGATPAPPQAVPKPTVDYAAIAAKYATPLPTINSSYNSQASKSGGQAAVTPSTTTYGVVNGASNASTAKHDASSPSEKSNSSLKKILLIIGIPIFIVAYAIIWIIVFKVDISSFLPLP